MLAAEWGAAYEDDEREAFAVEVEHALARVDASSVAKHELRRRWESARAM